jgi:predicted GNAT family acetyltransferase
MDPATFALNESRNRYEITLGGDVIGFSRYRDEGEQRVFLHTEVNPEFQGHGLATQLIEFSLADVRAQHKRIVAICPMVAAYVAKNHDYDDILDVRDATPR